MPTTSRATGKPRLVLLTDVSLSVRATARFTLHLVHGMQSLFTQARSFAFVDLPRYAEFCDRVQVVADLTGLQRAAQQMSAEATGR